MEAQLDYSAMTPADILKEWITAMLDGLGPGLKFDPAVTDPKGAIAEHYRGTIQAEIDRRLKSVEGSKGFDEKAHRASTRVAHDLGLVCRVMAEATKDKTVTVDMFQRAKKLIDLHPSCPKVVSGPGGGGPYC